MAGVLCGMGIDGNVPMDLKRSMGYFESGCRRGDKAGCYQAAMIARYAPAEGLSHDYKKALKYFNKACRAGSLSSCREIATMYERGLGVEKDGEKANRYHQLSMPQFRSDSSEV